MSGGGEAFVSSGVKKAFFLEARQSYHAALVERVLCIDELGIPSNADRGQKSSVLVAHSVAERLGVEVIQARLAGQMSGNQFEDVTAAFISSTFQRVRHLRPGKWEVIRITARGGAVPAISAYEQYAHLVDIKRAIKVLSKTDPKLAASLGGDYTISPDVVIIRHPEPDADINAPAFLVDSDVASRSSLRASNGGMPLLHASISCKWTLRSDRAQNARTEALNLMRNRKGRLPHIVVVTGEPLPTRLASLAMGTGDADCVYHFALPELMESIDELGMEDHADMLRAMIQGKRLKDISDLPLDLAV
jgi:hypothetical protein